MACIDAERDGAVQAARQSCEEEKRLLVDYLREKYEEQKGKAKLQKLKACAMIGTAW